MKSPTSILWDLWDDANLLYPTDLGVQKYAQAFDVPEEMIKNLAMRRYLRKSVQSFIDHYGWTPAAVVDFLRLELAEIEQGNPPYGEKEVKP
jgi:hypothetical protein